MESKQSLEVPPPASPAPQSGEEGKGGKEVPEDVLDTIKNMDIDIEQAEPDIKVKEVDGKNFYECGTCGKSFGTQRGAKSHMRTHTKVPETPTTNKNSKRKERTPDQEDKKKPKTAEPEEEYKFPLEDFEKFFEGSSNTSTQQEKQEELYNGELDGEVTLGSFDVTETIDNEEVVVVEETKSVIEEELEALKKENEGLKKDIKSKNYELAIKDDSMKILQGQKNSLEEENEGLKSQVNELEVKAIDLKAEYVKVGKCAEKVKTMLETRSGGNVIQTRKENDELKEKVKKLNNMVINKNKDNNEATKKIKLLTDEVEKESNFKNRAEVETTRATEMLNLYKELLEKEKNKPVDENVDTRRRQEVQPKCRTFDKWGSCPRGDSCNYFHPLNKCQAFLQGLCDRGAECREAHFVNKERSSPNRLESKSDCSFWLDGWCKFNEERCGRKHEPAKKGTKQADFRRGPAQDKGLEQELSKRCTKEQMEEIKAILSKNAELENQPGGNYQLYGQSTQGNQNQLIPNFQGLRQQAMVNQPRNSLRQPVQPFQPGSSFKASSQTSPVTHTGGTFEQSFQPTSLLPWQQPHTGGATAGQGHVGGQGGQPYMVMVQPGQQVVWTNPGAGGVGGQQ